MSFLHNPEIEFKLDLDDARLLARYMRRITGYNEPRKTTDRVIWLSETLADTIGSNLPEEPTEIGSVVQAPLHDDDDPVTWVCAGEGRWMHERHERFWDDLDVWEITRIGSDVSDETFMTKRVKSSIGMLIELAERTESSSLHSGRTLNETDAVIKTYLYMASFYEDMLAERDPRYKRRVPGTMAGSAGKGRGPIELGTSTEVPASEVDG